MTWQHHCAEQPQLPGRRPGRFKGLRNDVNILQETWQSKTHQGLVAPPLLALHAEPPRAGQ